MPYFVTIVRNNGYRCSCCSRNYPEHFETSTLENALKYLPLSLPKPDPEEDRSLDTDTMSVSIEDENERVVARGDLDFPGYKQYSYRASKWSGFTPAGTFEDVDYGSYKDKVKSWDHLIALTNVEYNASKLATAEETLKEAQRKRDYLKSLLDKYQEDLAKF